MNKYKEYLRTVKDGLNLEDVCTALVKYNGYYIKNVPKKFITQEMCWHAIKENVDTFIDIPEEFKTEEICWYAVKDNYNYFKFVPEKYKTSTALVRFNGENTKLEMLQYVSKKKSKAELDIGTINYINHNNYYEEGGYIYERVRESLNEMSRERFKERFEKIFKERHKELRDYLTKEEVK